MAVEKDTDTLTPLDEEDTNEISHSPRTRKVLYGVNDTPGPCLLPLFALQVGWLLSVYPYPLCRPYCISYTEIRAGTGNTVTFDVNSECARMVLRRF